MNVHEIMHIHAPKQWLRKEKEKMHFINSKTNKKWTIEKKGKENKVFANIKNTLWSNTNMSSVNHIL